MKIVIDENLCIACGNCVDACEECFAMDDSGEVAKVIKEECDSCDLHEVAQDCPVGAIEVED
jgi:ferredoxin